MLHRGVSAVGHRILRPQAYRLAAARACGEGAVLSFAAGAAHWELRHSAATLIDVTVPRAGQRRRPGIRVHRHASLRPDEVTVHQLVPVTTPARTLLDLAATFPRRTLERAVDAAERLELFDLLEIRSVLDAHRGRPFERDRERDAILAAAGIFTLRFTDLQLERRPEEVESALTVPLSMLLRLR